MGLDAQVIAIGPYSADITHALEYPIDFYRSVSPGATVITHVFEALTTDASFALAACFGVDAMDFGRHVLDAHAADIQKLRQTTSDVEVKHFLALRDAGFQFYYLPNA